MEPRIQYAKTADGVSIAYATQGEGPALVYLASSAVSHVQRGLDMFPNIFPPMTTNFRLIRFDPRGTGLSDRDEIDFSMQAMTRDFDAVVERTGLQSFAIEAFTTSVPIAVTYAATFPERVSHLILIDGWASWPDVVDMPTWKAIEALIDQDWTVQTETLARVLLGMDEPQVIEGGGEYVRACIEPEAYRALIAALQSWEVVDLLPNVTAQTLVLQNNDSHFAPVRAGRKLAAGIPGARLLTIDDTNYERLPPLVESFMGIAGEVEHGDITQTILFTDMESSTALTQQLGDARAQELVRAHNIIVREALGEHAGREIKHTGDGIMASFAGASSALGCAVAIQKAVAARAAEQPEVPLGLRVGLNAGEPVVEEQDLFGASVQLAKRICDPAEPGQILASNVVRELAMGKGFLFGDIGEVVPKGFEEPVRLYEVRWRES